MAKSAMQQKRSNFWRKLLTAFTLLALVLLIYFSRDQITETFHRIDEVKWYYLLLIPVWQLLNYHSYTKLYQGLFDILGTKLKYKPLYKASVELNFVNHVFPSAGVSGFSYFGLRMKQLGATAGQSALVQTMRFITVFISFQALLLFGVLALAINGKASNLAIFVATTLGTSLVAGTLGIIYVVGSKSRIDSFFTSLTKALNYLIKLVRPNHPETINIASVRKLFLEFHENYEILKKNYLKLRMPLIYALLSSVTEILTLYAVYMAFGNWVNIGAVILAYAVANFAGLISVMPGGIGVYEGLMTAVLATVGVPPSQSLPITVMYRILSMGVQLPPGYYLYSRALHRKDRPLVS